MIVALRFYGILTDLAGRNMDTLEIDDGSTFAEIKNLLENKYPDFSKYTIVYFQNANRCSIENIVKKEVEIECMPPFSGG